MLCPYKAFLQETGPNLSNTLQLKEMCCLLGQSQINCSGAQATKAIQQLSLESRDKGGLTVYTVLTRKERFIGLSVTEII